MVFGDMVVVQVCLARQTLKNMCCVVLLLMIDFWWLVVGLLGNIFLGGYRVRGHPVAFLCIFHSYMEALCQNIKPTKQLRDPQTDPHTHPPTSTHPRTHTHTHAHRARMFGYDCLFISTGHFIVRPFVTGGDFILISKQHFKAKPFPFLYL